MSRTGESAWKLFNPTEIYFDLKFPEFLHEHFDKRSTLYITSQGATRRGVTKIVENFFKGFNISHFILEDANPNPSFEDLKHFARQLQNFKPEQIITLGGGSVMDLGKILSYALSDQSPGVENMLEMLTHGKALPLIEPIPTIAIPTTAGTGSEVTPFATLWDSQNKKKYSVSGKTLYPKKALLCSDFTLTLPWDVTLSTGLDAFSQSIESVWNKNYIPETGALAAKAVHLIMTSLPALKNNPDNATARMSMMEASLMGGLCISVTRTAMAHSISYPLTAHFGTSHGVACSFTLPQLWDYNLQADDGRMIKFCKELNVRPEKFGEEIFNFMKKLDFSAELKKTIKNIPAVLKLCPEMYTPGRSDNNLRDFSAELLPKFVEQSLNSWL
jgi:phosphonate metabolism-associated iron-containing alcohol dehydrogenase